MCLWSISLDQASQLCGISALVKINCLINAMPDHMDGKLLYGGSKRVKLFLISITIIGISNLKDKLLNNIFEFPRTL